MATDAVSHDALPALPAELHPVVDHFVTEDEAPVDNVFSEKQQRLLTESLHTSWPGPGGARPFVAMANVGLFYAVRLPPVVPDALLSVNVSLPVDVWPKNARSYLVWEYGRAPDVVIEVVSNREGGEDTEKMTTYAEIGVRYYAIFDPARILSGEMFRAYRLRALSFEKIVPPVWFPEVGLGLTLWEGRYEDLDATWLRWVDAQGALIATGKEQRDRADRFAAQLRSLGIEPQEK